MHEYKVVKIGAHVVDVSRSSGSAGYCWKLRHVDAQLTDFSIFSIDITRQQDLFSGL